MATALTGWKCTHTASITSQTDTTATIKVECYWKNDGWRYNVSYIYGYVYCNSVKQTVFDNKTVNNSTGAYDASTLLGSYSFTINKTTAAQSISCYAEIKSNNDYCGKYTRSSSATTLSIPAKTSYTVTYNANNGTGAPTAQTKWYGTALTLSSTKPTRAGYTFKGWGTSASATTVSYNPGGSYTSNASITLYAIWTANTYTVTYNANGGSGAPSNQTKTHGVNLTLSSTKPTRTNYNFVGWGTSASATTVSYNAGGTYSQNASITLYAIWSQSYTEPRITNLEAYRCDSSGNSNIQGTYVRLIFDVATDKAITTLDLYKKSTGNWASAPLIPNISNTGGHVDLVLGNFTANTAYSIYVYVADSGGSTTSPTLTIGGMYTIDILSGGNGVAFGKEADSSGYLDCNFKAKFRSTAEFASTPTVNGTAVSLSNHSHTDYAPTGHSHSEYFPVAGGNISGNTTIHSYFAVNNPNAVISNNRFTEGWVGFYGTATDAQNNTNRKGYIGHDKGVPLYIVNEKAGYLYFTTAGDMVQITAKKGDTTYEKRWNFESTANYVGLRPSSSYNGQTNLGSSSSRWATVYAATGSINTSDRNLKKDFTEFDERYENLFMDLKPQLFKFKDGTSDRFHSGFVSNDVEESLIQNGLTALDFAGFCKDKKQTLKEIDKDGVEVMEYVFDENGEPVYEYSLRYDEFIALNTHMIQKQQEEIESLKNEVAELKALVNQLLGRG